MTNAQQYIYYMLQLKILFFEGVRWKFVHNEERFF